MLTGNNRPEEPGALASDSDNSPPRPHRWPAQTIPAQRLPTQHVRPLSLQPCDCKHRAETNKNNRDPEQITPICIPVPFHF